MATTPIEDVSFNTDDFKVLADYVKRLAASEQRIALEKSTQDDIFEDATNAFESKDLKKAQIKKLIKACYDNDKTQAALDELDATMDIVNEVQPHL